MCLNIKKIKHIVDNDFCFFLFTVTDLLNKVENHLIPVQNPRIASLGTLLHKISHKL